MAKLVVFTKSLAGLTYELDGHWVTVGRALTNAFSIPDPSVSGQHCEVLARNNELIIRDMRSTNGTFVEGGMITEGSIKLGECFRIGEVEICFEDSEGLKPPPKLAIPQPTLSVQRDDAAGGIRPSETTLTAKKHQVLLVDDSMAFLETMGETLATMSEGAWEIHRAASADTALIMLQKHSIELAVLDINMPMLDGVQLLRVIQRRHPDVKKVVLTGCATDGNRLNSLANGAELFLEKPMSPRGITSVFNLLNDLFVWSQREGFSGTLRQVGLTDVIQIECLRRSSCILEVHNPETHGSIYIESGDIVHATAGPLIGETALFRLLGLRNGEFRVQPFQSPRNRSVRGTWECLLMEAARVIDEARQRQASEDTVLISKPGVVPGQISREESHVSPSGRTAATDREYIDNQSGETDAVASTCDGTWHPLDGNGS